MKLQELLLPAWAFTEDDWHWKNFDDMEPGDLFLCGMSDTLFMKLSTATDSDNRDGASAVRLVDGECWTFNPHASVRAL